jgi:hypothetical protein
MSTPEQAVPQQPVVESVQGNPNPQIVWDDSAMQSSYANVCNVLGTREEIMLMFGSNQAWQQDQKEVKVKLTNRIVLNPYAAKRLMAMLEIGLREYEARYGELKL